MIKVNLNGNKRASSIPKLVSKPATFKVIAPVLSRNDRHISRIKFQPNLSQANFLRRVEVKVD